MLDFARILSPLSVCSYAVWRLAHRRDPIVLTTRLGARFELRPKCNENNDYGVAYEVFVHNFYKDRPPESENVRLVVDLGANVGYSLLYYLHAYKNCYIIAFEPHPGHAAQAVRNLNIDGSRERVQLYPKGAGAYERKMRLTDSGTSSTLTEVNAKDTIGVEVVDIFPILEGRRIDILKVDIEGGEYEILKDPRFSRLDVGAIVMEWHSRGGGLADKAWCEERLKTIGYGIEDIFTSPTHGMFYARAARPLH